MVINQYYHKNYLFYEYETKRAGEYYVEITNKCNLHCSFCSKLNRKLRTMSVDEFSKVIDEIKEYTDYIYLHVKGEPLLHIRVFLHGQ